MSTKSKLEHFVIPESKKVLKKKKKKKKRKEKEDIATGSHMQLQLKQLA